MEFLAENKKTIIAISLLVGLYVLSKMPAMEQEQELLQQAWTILVLGAVGTVPSFRRSKHMRRSDK